jgi:hypothetical protein
MRRKREGNNNKRIEIVLLTLLKMRDETRRFLRSLTCVLYLAANSVSHFSSN